MTDTSTDPRQRVRGWLRQHGAERIQHPGGTLYAHLSRVHDRLCGYELDVHLQLAGLAHAVYGTDGFATALTDPSDRVTIRALVGTRAEALIFLYGGCDRARSWRRLADTGEVVNRFTGQVETLDPAQLRPFVDLTIVNELDVIEQDPAVAAEHGPYLRNLFASWAPVASPQVTSDARQVLGFDIRR
jgi:hypothetical protein